MSNPYGSQAQHSASRKKSLIPIFYELDSLEYRNPGAAHRVLDEFVHEIDEYVGAPDFWHNIIASAGRINRNELQLVIVHAALREWPDDVDLLCDELQCYRIYFYDLVQAARVWDHLTKLPLSIKAPYWRYWVYGANYLAHELNDPGSALDLLDQGANMVRRDGLMNVLRAYRNVLVNNIPPARLADDVQVRRTQEEAQARLESRYRFGIQLGLEGAYVLAMELALLHQEQAGQERAVGDQSVTHAQNVRLEEALRDLDLAEALYTADQNHPIHEIYEQRARIFMAQRRYGDALKLLRCLPEFRLQEPSVRTMLQLAARSIGETVDEDSSRSLTREQLVGVLLANGGEVLRQLLRTDPGVQEVVIGTLQQMAAARGQGGGDE